MSDETPRASMSQVCEDRWDAIFGERKLPHGRPGPRRERPLVAIPQDIGGGDFTESQARAAMDSMTGQLVRNGMDAGQAQRVARQSALRKDARNHGRAHAHITTRKEG